LTVKPDRYEIARLIVQKDPAFQDLVRTVGPPPSPRPAPVSDRFASLVRSISFQLLATAAASTIHRRVLDACEGDTSVATLLTMDVTRLRSAGLSRAKAEAMIELAGHVHDGRIRLERHGYMGDHDVIREVTAVRGIGPWTAQMYLMFTLARRDVWPAGDFGVRNGWSQLHGLDEMISERALRDAGAAFEGFRSSVAYYCWRVVDGPLTDR
jgi:3-methyladenine DNA glycosylase/8-oxoguanine DNA glycosylase